MDVLTMFALIALAGGIGSAGYFISKSKKLKNNEKDSETDSEGAADVSKESIVIEARAKAKELILEAKDESLKIKVAAEKEAKKTTESFSGREKEITVKETQLNEREKEIEEKARSLKGIRERIENREEEIEALYKKQKTQLEEISSLTKEEAKNILLQKFDKELVEEKAKRIREMEEKIKKNSEEQAQEILLDALKYGATDCVIEHTTSKVKLNDDELKGRIIGKAGRNITTFEELTGVELDLDASPGEILISSFDSVRREIARIALERLIADGRIQPSRIEEVVKKTQSEVEHIMFKEGDNLCHKIGVYELPREIVQTLGRFKYRFSYGQNMIEHTLEVTRLGVSLAHELGVNVDLVKQGCLLHDIGKVITDEEGSHVQVGVSFLRKHNIPDEVINAVAEHHEDKPYSSVESAVVGLADHISGARPSARSEDYESYVKRMKDLEGAALEFDGVEKAYAISAGREVRVFVQPEIVDDISTALLAREIARKIELEQSYPGVVKVTVIRETRVSETAK